MQRSPSKSEPVSWSENTLEIDPDVTDIRSKHSYYQESDLTITDSNDDAQSLNSSEENSSDDENSEEYGEKKTLEELQKETKLLKQTYFIERDKETLKDELELLNAHYADLLLPELRELYAYRRRLMQRIEQLDSKNTPKKNLKKLQKEFEAELNRYQKLKQKLAAVNSQAEAQSQEGDSSSSSDFEFYFQDKAFISPRYSYLQSQLNPPKLDEAEKSEETDEAPKTVESGIRDFVRKSMRYIGKAFDTSSSIGNKTAQALDDVPSAMQAGLLSEDLAETIGTYLLSGAGIVIFGIEVIRSGTKLIKIGINIVKTLSSSEKERFTKAKDLLLEAALPAASFVVCLGGLAVSGMLLATIFGASLYFVEFLPFFVTVGVAALATKELIESVKEYRLTKKLVEKHLKPTPDGKYPPLEKAKEEYMASLKVFNREAGKLLARIKELEREKVELRLQADQLSDGKEKDKLLREINKRSQKQVKLDLRFANLESELNKKKKDFETLDGYRIDFINAKTELGFASVQLALSISICVLAFISTAAFIGLTTTTTLGIVPGALIIALATVGLAIKVFQEAVKLQSDRKDYTYLEAAKDLFYTYPLKKPFLGVYNWIKKAVTAAPAPAPATDPFDPPSNKKSLLGKGFSTYKRLSAPLDSVIMEDDNDNDNKQESAYTKTNGKKEPIRSLSPISTTQRKLPPNNDADSTPPKSFRRSGS